MIFGEKSHLIKFFFEFLNEIFPFLNNVCAPLAIKILFVHYLIKTANIDSFDSNLLRGKKIVQNAVEL